MSNYNPRMNVPKKSNKYYINYDFGGYNVAIPIDKTTGWVMPNCVGYAQGRYREICGDKKIWSDVGTYLSGNAETFWNNAKENGFKTGQIPRLGSIIVYEGVGSAAGHVAIVEDIVLNDSKTNIDYIIASNSAYKGEEFYKLTLKRDEGYLYNKDGSRPLLGFIYQDEEFENDPTNGLFTEGFLDFANLDGKNLSIGGWAWNGIEDTPVTVYVTITNSKGETMVLLTDLANDHREDLIKEGKGNGDHGFSMSYNVSNYEPGEYTVTAETVYNKKLINTKNFTIPQPIQNKPVIPAVTPSAKAPSGLNETTYPNYEPGTNKYYRVKTGAKQIGAYVVWANAYRKWLTVKNNDGHIYDANMRKIV